MDGKRLEARRIPALASSFRAMARPPVVMLHEGLGSVSQWRDFPDRVAAQTGCEVFVYSRYGYGQSDVLEGARDVSYMHHEAEIVLPAILDQAKIRKPILFGHSDGASIAILYAAKFPDSPVALILEAPHVFVEDLTIKSIAAARIAYETTDLPQKVARHHKDADRTFWGWNDVWLDPRFRAWNIERSLDAIRCPVLIIQGEDDEYGTRKQIDAIQARVPAAMAAMLADSKHSPHRDQPEATLQHVIALVNSL